jgi:hypothetical protein
VRKHSSVPGGYVNEELGTMHDSKIEDGAYSNAATISLADAR